MLQTNVFAGRLQAQGHHGCGRSACHIRNAKIRVCNTPEGDRKHLRPNAPASSKPCSCSGSPEFCGVRPPHMPTSTCSLPCTAARSGGSSAVRHSHITYSAQPDMRTCKGANAARGAACSRQGVQQGMPTLLDGEQCAAHRCLSTTTYPTTAKSGVMVAVADADLGRVHLLTQELG
jgi:hypothetical protein